MTRVEGVLSYSVRAVNSQSQRYQGREVHDAVDPYWQRMAHLLVSYHTSNTTTGARIRTDLHPQKHGPAEEDQGRQTQVEGDEEGDLGADSRVVDGN